jgi:hypothetical protein
MTIAYALARLNGRSLSFSLEFSLILSLFQDKESKRTEQERKSARTQLLAHEI